jgi:hypothetical protein
MSVNGSSPNTPTTPRVSIYQNISQVRYNPYFYLLTYKGKPLENLLKIWLVMVKNGALQETQSPKRFCERAWFMQTGMPETLATEEFMQSCVRDCHERKREFRWFIMTKI